MRKQPSHHVSLVVAEAEVVPDLFRRLFLVLILIALVTAILWLDREGLRDTANPDRPLGIIDVIYFTVVTLTTVGYGDIVPVSDRARLISTLIVTPVRIFILIIFIGTAYQLIIQRYREAYQMRKIHKHLMNHVIVCGYGVKGHATVAELRSFGKASEDIVVIDPDEDTIKDAASEGLIAFKGDATSETVLKTALIEKAKSVIINTNRDDTTVLICLTAKHLNPDAYVAAAARETENVPLIYQSGADVVVTPPVAGGRMLAIATQLSHVPRFLEDILTFGRGIDFGEKHVGPSQAGLTINQMSDLANKLIIGAYHRDKIYIFSELDGVRFDTGDVIIYLTEAPQSRV